MHTLKTRLYSREFTVRLYSHESFLISFKNHAYFTDQALQSVEVTLRFHSHEMNLFQK